MSKYENGYRISSVHLKMVKERKVLYGENLTSPSRVHQMLTPLFKGSDREKFVVISLLSSMEPVAFEVVAIGGANECFVDIKSIFKHALLANASYLIVAHNHPSGSTKPSTEDFDITRRIKQAGELLGIGLADHVIYADCNRFYSFHENGQI